MYWISDTFKSNYLMSNIGQPIYGDSMSVEKENETAVEAEEADTKADVKKAIERISSRSEDTERPQSNDGGCCG
jgi:hypothetical protein